MTASCLYIGEVTHRRLRPKEHALRYRLFQTFLDLDEAKALSDASLVFGFNRAALLSFYERDHGDGSKTPLKVQVEARVRAAGFDVGGPVRVLCLPRVLGFVFNPITVYFCHGPHWNLTAMVYEVNNTFGDRICYVLPAEGAAVIEHSAPKAMHVSPFMDMEHDYDFLLNEPGDRFSLAIHVRRDDQLWLTAGFSGERRPFTDRALLAAWARHPVLTLKVVAGIHWEALKIWRKGVKYRPKPHGRVRLEPVAEPTEQAETLKGIKG